jgi:large exoprotein involved in heme utilization and adhesion
LTIKSTPPFPILPYTTFNHSSVILSNNATITSAAFFGGRKAGSIEIDAQNGDVRLGNSSLIFPLADRIAGQIGGVKITATNLELDKGSRIDSDNNTAQVAGPIDIQVRNLLRLTGISEIETTTTFGSSRAADIIIKASEVRILEGSKLSADTEAASTGAGGRVSIQGLVGSSDSVTVDGPGSGIFTGANGIGPGGAIDLVTRSLSLQNGGTLSAETAGTNSKATGGSIIINATDHVTLTNGGTITASSTGPADAGKIDINAGQQLDLLDNSSITTTTQSAQANGGNIDIRAVDRVRLVNNSEISTSVMGAEGSGGNIFIDPKVVVLQGSNVTAQAVGGTGGNITFVTPLFLADSASVISASSQRGVSGTVTIQSPTSNLSGTVGQLVSKLSPPQVLLQNRCVALAGGEQSTFLLSGRNTLPAEPGGWLSSPVQMEHWRGEVPEEHVSRLMVRSRGLNRQPLLVMSKDQTTVLSLRQLTPPGFLVRSFAASAPTGCSS